MLCAPIMLVGSLAAACGGNSSSPSAAASPSPAASPSAAASPLPGDAGPNPTVATASNKLGTILVDGHGATLYEFGIDGANSSKCTGTCAGDWYPFTTTEGAPTAGTGATASMLGTFTRADGSTQISYNSHPLYYYSDDMKKPGSILGQGNTEYGGLWETMTPAGALDTVKQ